MNTLYRKLAVTNIKNNRQFYQPYLLTGILSVAMFYLVTAMQDNPGWKEMQGGADVKLILGFGVVIVGVFVSIFLFYTNSFIIKRRKKELGVYNILGMEKKHLARVLFLEMMFTAAAALTGGLVLGLVFQKLMTMVLYRLIGISESISFYVSGPGCIHTFELFLLIYGAALLYNMMQIKLANPIELLHSANTGEREPKTKLLLTIIGLAALGAGYYIALNVENAINALTLFFAAVLLVIIGTYCIFTAGSIALLKLLRRNKKFYYQPKHFTTVSGMIYRMKQNAVGLANICILSTMVLVTVSTTVSMYLGIEALLDTVYPHEISATVYYTEMPKNEPELEQVVTDSLKASGRIVSAEPGYFGMTFTTLCKGNEMTVTGIGAGTNYDSSDVIMIKIMTAADYEIYSGQKVAELSKGEVAFAVSTGFAGEIINFEGTEYVVKESFQIEEESGWYASTVKGVGCLIVPDAETMQEIFLNVKSNWDSPNVKPSITYQFGIDIDGSAEEKLNAEAAMKEAAAVWESENGSEIYMECKEEHRNSCHVLYGGLFFLGIFLGTLFLMVTVLIIFYKQISEGYEDKERFAIMEKVGMSNDEVKRAIRSQVLMVFFLPLAVAALHVGMAFPMITLILQTLSLMNTSLFAACVAGTELVFGIIYLLVFLLTSRSYYKIVGNQI